MDLIYKIVPKDLWQDAEARGVFAGAPVDVADGFIHLSTAAQVRGTAAHHFAGEDGLLLVGVDPQRLGAALRYEPSRGGALFPHLYAALNSTRSSGGGAAARPGRPVIISIRVSRDRLPLLYLSRPSGGTAPAPGDSAPADGQNAVGSAAAAPGR